MEVDVIVIGAGLSGLTAGLLLQQSGQEVLLLEASDRPGGRMKTDLNNGFRLDHGFQIYLSAYPAGHRLLDLKALKFKHFAPGAFLLHNGKRYTLGDPQRRPSTLLSTLMAPVGGLGQKLNMLKAKNKLRQKSLETIWAQSPKNVIDCWQEDYGFEDDMINNFLKPFYQGIFFDTELSTDRKMFEFIFKMFAEGNAVVPQYGIEEIPKQLAGRLKPGTLQVQKKVIGRQGNTVFTEDGDQFTGQVILYACPHDGFKDHLWKQSTTVYFTAPATPYRRPMISLLTDSQAWTNNMVVMSQVSSAYAPKGQSLIAISSAKPIPDKRGTRLQELIKKELQPYFKTSGWEHLETYHIPYSLPTQKYLPLGNGLEKVENNVYTCGDHQAYGASNAAMEAGELAAKTILRLV
jgi:hypothetical protein